jgi:hypothetical protein
MFQQPGHIGSQAVDSTPRTTGIISLSTFTSSGNPQAPHGANCSGKP